jgi:hypothetical protein
LGTITQPRWRAVAPGARTFAFTQPAIAVARVRLHSEQVIPDILAEDLVQRRFAVIGFDAPQRAA